MKQNYNEQQDLPASRIVAREPEPEVVMSLPFNHSDKSRIDKMKAIMEDWGAAKTYSHDNKVHIFIRKDEFVDGGSNQLRRCIKALFDLSESKDGCIIVKMGNDYDVYRINARDFEDAGWETFKEHFEEYLEQLDNLDLEIIEEKEISIIEAKLR